MLYGYNKLNPVPSLLTSLVGSAFFPKKTPQKQQHTLTQKEKTTKNPQNPPPNIPTMPCLDRFSVTDLTTRNKCMPLIAQSSSAAEGARILPGYLCLR